MNKTNTIGVVPFSTAAPNAHSNTILNKAQHIIIIWRTQYYVRRRSTFGGKMINEEKHCPPAARIEKVVKRDNRRVPIHAENVITWKTLRQIFTQFLSCDST